MNEFTRLPIMATVGIMIWAVIIILAGGAFAG